MAGVVDFPGVMAYGAIDKEAVGSAQALALRVLAPEMEAAARPRFAPHEMETGAERRHDSCLHARPSWAKAIPSAAFASMLVFLPLEWNGCAFFRHGARGGPAFRLRFCVARDFSRAAEAMAVAASRGQNPTGLSRFRCAWHRGRECRPGSRSCWRTATDSK